MIRELATKVLKSLFIVNEKKRRRGRRPGTHTISEEKKEMIVKLTRDGLNRPTIAKIVGVNKTTVWKYQKLLLE